MGTMLLGSMYRVAPLVEASWTMPEMASFLGRFHGDHEAIAPLGNHRFLNGIAVLLENVVELLINLAALVLELLANAAQLGSSAIGHFAAIVDAVVNVLLQFGIGAEGRNELREGGQLVRFKSIDRAPQLPGSRQGGGDVKQFGGLQEALPLGPLQRIANILDARKLETGRMLVNL